MEKQLEAETPAEGTATSSPSPSPSDDGNVVAEQVEGEPEQEVGSSLRQRLHIPQFQIPRNARAEKYSRAVRDVIVQMFEAVRGGDLPSRRMAILFFIGVLGVAIVLSIVYERYIRYQDLRKYQSTAAEQTSKNLGEFIQKQAEHAKHKFSTLTLGKFTVDIAPIDSPPPARGVNSVAEVEIVIECDSKETRYFIEDNLARAQDQITNVFASLTRDDLLSRDGKKKLKARLIEKLNGWLPSGKVEDLFFNDLVIS
ncbi:MAG TPA: flagellar basal body-associated FliL family protein [Bdellovibrionota bacterium]|nr:flagellar basal body-associated FliL family protein [Bdellovibrionota bacterium]